MKSEKYQEALNYYSKALEVDPDNKIINAILHNNKAIVLSKMGKHEEALKETNLAIKENDKYVKAYLKRADIKKTLG